MLRHEIWLPESQVELDQKRNKEDFQMCYQMSEISSDHLLVPNEFQKPSLHSLIRVGV